MLRPPALNLLTVFFKMRFHSLHRKEHICKVNKITKKSVSPSISTLPIKLLNNVILKGSNIELKLDNYKIGLYVHKNNITS